MNRTCTVDECGTATIRGRALCNRHQMRVRRHGDPHTTRWTIADETDVALIVECPRPVEGLTPLERVLIARGLTGKRPDGRPMTAEQIAEVVGVSPRTVYRWRRAEPASARRASLNAA